MKLPPCSASTEALREVAAQAFATAKAASDPKVKEFFNSLGHTANEIIADRGEWYAAPDPRLAN